MKWKDIAREVEALGGVMQSREGSHLVYKMPDGSLFTLICIRWNEQAPAGYVSKLKRVKRALLENA